MKKHLTIILILLFLYITFRSEAQQLPRFSQYYFNEFLINPAIAGYDGRTIVNLNARKQWIGFSDNTPQTALVSAQTRLLKHPFDIRTKGNGQRIYEKRSEGRVGLGAIVYNDQNGAIHRTGAQFTYAYHIFVRDNQLSFGLTGTCFNIVSAKKMRYLRIQMTR